MTELFERRHEVRRRESGTALVVEVGRTVSSPPGCNVLECTVRDVGDHAIALVPPDGLAGPPPNTVVLVTREPGEWWLGCVGRSSVDELIVGLLERSRRA
jgi:hypothetical protein